MKRTLLGLTCACWLLTAAAAAQSPSAPRPPARQASAQTYEDIEIMRRLLDRSLGLPRYASSYVSSPAHANFSGGFGGPILQNRTFFWFATEGYGSNTTRNGSLRFPTSRERNGDFSDTRDANGNLVVSDTAGTVLWSTGTAGKAGAYAKVQDDGNFVVYGADNKAVWNSKTYRDPFSVHTTTYTYDAAGRPTTVTGKQTSAFTYDADGNRVTTKTNGTLSRTLTWDVNNPLPQIATETNGSGALIGDYAYDPLGLLPVENVTPSVRDAILAKVPALQPFTDLGPRFIVVVDGVVYRFGTP